MFGFVLVNTSSELRVRVSVCPRLCRFKVYFNLFSGPAAELPSAFSSSPQLYMCIHTHVCVSPHMCCVFVCEYLLFCFCQLCQQRISRRMSAESGMCGDYVTAAGGT